MLKKLRKANETRSKKFDKDSKLSVEFFACQLAEEAGEVCGAIKKMRRLKHGIPGGKDMMENLVEELGDVIISADLLAMQFGIDLEKAVKNKFNATSKKRGFSERL